MKLVTAGGRHYGEIDPNYPEDAPVRFKEREVVDVWLRRLVQPGWIVSHGHCRTGADRLVDDWLRANGFIPNRYPAEWSKHGDIPEGTPCSCEGQRYCRVAGPRRNRWMIAHARPDLVLAFPGGNGTDDLVTVARAADVPVIRAWGIERTECEVLQ